MRHVPEQKGIGFATVNTRPQWRQLHVFIGEFLYRWDMYVCESTHKLSH